MKSENARESAAVITGLGMACLALFTGVSLYTHSPYDVMDYHAAASHEIQNKAGLFGAQMAHHLFCLYGAGAWVITAAMLVFGALMCSLRSMSGLITRTFGAILLTVLVCAWYGALDDHRTISGDYPAGPGGLVGGTFVAPALINYFGRIGVFLVLATAGLLACLLLAQSLTEAALAMVGRGVVAGATAFAHLIIRKVSNAGTAPAPALAFEGATARKTGAFNAKDAHVNTDTDVLDIVSARERVLPIPEQRRFTVPASDLPPAGTNRVVRTEAPEAAVRELPPVEKTEKAEKPEKKVSRLPQAEPEPEMDDAERRREEAMRQAEAAEATRLEREKQMKEQVVRETKALEKLEKERAAQDKERAKQQEKFAAAMADAAAKNAKANGTENADAAEPQKPKPQLPVNYSLPKYDLLIENDIAPVITSDLLKERGATVIQTLWDFKIESKLVGIQSGPAVTMYELELSPGIKVQRVVSLQDNLAMAMKAEHGVRIIAPIPGRASIGIEIPNVEDHTVRMRPILESTFFRSKSWTLPLILGRDAIGNPLVADLANMPHLLIAGTTGSGKSVCVNSIILSIMILRRPHEVKLILVDPKQVEMTDFKGIPHLLSPVVTDMKLAAGVLTWAVQKMEQRYERMSKVGVRNIATFNKMSTDDRLARLPQDEPPEEYMDQMPYIVIIVDEFADLMMTAGKEIEQAIARLAQKARAAGIHVILATQRPSADVVTGLIKTNLPCRICFQVKSKIDSRIVLDQGGAEKLAGKGDMLYIGAGNSNLVRAKGVYIADDEIRGIVKTCKEQADPIYSDEIERVAAQAAMGDGEAVPENNRQAIELDEKFDEGVEVFLACGRASTSLLQRRMGLGYTRAAKLCDQMEARGIVGPDRGAKGRELLITAESWSTYKTIRANANGSAFGPKGSKDNPGVPSGDIPSPAPTEDPVKAELIAQLHDVDGVKDEDEE